MAGQLQNCPGYSLLGELHLEFTHGERWPSFMCAHANMRNCMMSMWTTSLHTYTSTAFFSYE